MKKIPGLVAGTGSEDYPYPIPVLVCSKCGTIEKSYRDLLAKGEKYQAENETSSSLIL